MMLLKGSFAPAQIIRQGSTLAEKVRLAGGGQSTTKSVQTSSSHENVVDATGEQFREFFVMPKRKLRGQMQIEQATGRTAIVQKSRGDLHERLSVRKDRSREMSTDQDWPSVWPAARTFNASVVPLPVRMGTRKYPEKRAPFKKHGNLELVKIPNFLHLTPAAIERQCEAVKKFCTKFPSELKSAERFAEEFPVSVEYSSYVHQGTNIRDPRARVVTLKVKLASLGLSESQREKFVRLVAHRFDKASDVLTIVCDRCPTRRQNLEYAHYLLTVLFHESKKVEAWDSLKERRDNLKIEFNGSECEKKLTSIIEAQKKDESAALPQDVTEDLKKFKEMWSNYRNTPETPEQTREYGKLVRQLMGLGSNATPTPTEKSS